MKAKYLLEADTELLDAGKAEAERRGISFAKLLREALMAALDGKERLAEPDQGRGDLGVASDARKDAPASTSSGSASIPPYLAWAKEGDPARVINLSSPGTEVFTPAPSKPAPTVERCDLRNPLAPALHCGLDKGHKGGHLYA